MRFSPIVPSRRPVFGRRQEPPVETTLNGPTSEERRLIERIMRHIGPRDTR